MARTSASEFLERLGKGKPVPAIVLLGDEPYLRDRCRAELIEKFVPEAVRTWAVSRFSAANGETVAALGQAQTLPMLSPLQVVFLEEVETIEKLGDRNREETIEAIEGYLGDPAPFTLLVMEASGLDQRMKVAKLLTEKALAVDVGMSEDADQRIAVGVSLAKSLAKERGIGFENGAAEDLAEFVGGDLMRLTTELEKLSTYAADTKLVRRQDVSALVISEKTTTIWEVADLLATGQTRKAMEFLERLLREGEEPLQMLGAMAWMYRKLIAASEVRGVTNGWQAARALGMRPEQAEIALRSARKTTKARLLQGLRALQAADDRLKRGGEDQRAIMEILVWQLSATKVAAAG